ncbi:smr domain containing protein [Grosmannia clavigera kw1407]|uniref:Smr domain containing protein n=1 Tax=Grosmannia clavigera (strain kw1407 / UAMH 11150) TaxID=655863 RepID=F0XUG9_GROCL|nr:smr domain containing protein [Grosmannia clavigera kw1407]EFW98442.1 smr domain containing protein [Grosmannia clavigera kw1407]
MSLEAQRQKWGAARNRQLQHLMAADVVLVDTTSNDLCERGFLHVPVFVIGPLPRHNVVSVDAPDAMASSAIPMTQLGERSFNHSAGNDAEAEYDRLRDLARQEAAKRNSCFDKSHQAYERGDGASAKTLSTEGKRHAAAMDDYNRQASEYIFRENNAVSRVAGDTIDLHGQFVEEAERILEQRIRAAQSQGQTHLHVIVGRGNHSANHVQKIKPAVEKLCGELGLQYATEENEGRVYVNLQGGAVSGVPPLPQQPSGHLGGYGGGGGGGYQPQSQPNYSAAAGQQQHHDQHQQHQQHQQNQQQQGNDQLEQEIEQAVGKCLPKLLRGCCTIM